MKRRKSHCINGHDIAVVGRYAGGACIMCQKENGARYYATKDPEAWRIACRERMRAHRARKALARLLAEGGCAPDGSE